MRIARNSILALLERWKPIGHEVARDGADLIGRVPHVAPLAWFHHVFPPLSLDGDQRLAADIPGFASSRVREVLREFNGCDLFSTNLYLLGQRTSYARDGSVHQPWDIYTDNVLDQHDEVPEDTLIVGGSNCLSDGVTTVETRDGRVEAYACASRPFRKRLRRLAGRPYRKLFEWASIDDWLLCEINRLSKLFDDQGRVVAPDDLARFDMGVQGTCNR